MRSPVVAAFLLLLAWAGDAIAADAWSEYRSEPAGFLVQFPADPAVTRQPIEGQPGSTETQFMVDQGAVAYMVMVSEYPSNSLPRSPDGAYFTTLRDTFAQATQGKVRTSRPLNIGPYSGSEAVIDNAPNVYVVHFYIVGDRLYQVLTGGPNGHEGSENAHRFLDSFRLIVQ